jgi:hypothetical protein
VPENERKRWYEYLGDGIDLFDLAEVVFRLVAWMIRAVVESLFSGL